MKLTEADMKQLPTTGVSYPSITEVEDDIK